MYLSRGEVFIWTSRDPSPHCSPRIKPSKSESLATSPYLFNSRELKSI
jgi:hypothetical protein